MHLKFSGPSLVPTLLQNFKDLEAVEEGLGPVEGGGAFRAEDMPMTSEEEEEEEEELLRALLVLLEEEI